LVYGDDPRNIFPVKIASTESVGTLKKVIKEENPESFHGVDARSLHLWHVSIPIDAGFREKVKKVALTDEEELSAVEYLTDVFSRVVIVICCPPPNPVQGTLIGRIYPFNILNRSRSTVPETR
jgi:hypothetical protein